jgi:hypothetical protein
MMASGYRTRRSGFQALIKVSCSPEMVKGERAGHKRSINPDTVSGRLLAGSKLTYWMAEGTLPERVNLLLCIGA